MPKRGAMLLVSSWKLFVSSPAASSCGSEFNAVGCRMWL
jgi:hypothetical protein